jgi:hypothetical protein
MNAILRPLPPIACVALSLAALSFSCGRSALPSGPFTEAPGSPIDVGPMAGRPVIADMNGDQKPDVVLACGTCCGSQPSPESGHVVVLLNDGAGKLVRRGGPRTLVGPSVRTLAVGDVNHDGKLDVAAAEHDTYKVTVLLGDGAGALTPAPGSPFVAATGTRPHTHAIALVDLNQDSNLDIVTTNANDNTISVLLGDGKAAFAAATGSPFSTGRHPYDSIGVCDANADGKQDLVVPLLAGNKIGVLFGDGTGGLTSPAEARYVVGERPGYVAVADVNGDQRPDIIGTHDDVGIVDVLLSDGNGKFAPAPGSPMRLATAVWGIATGDLDGDGKLDVALGGASGEDIVCLLGDGQGKFREATDWKLKAGRQPNYLAVGDLNGDGQADIVAANYGTGNVTILLRKAR